MSMYPLIITLCPWHMHSRGRLTKSKCREIPGRVLSGATIADPDMTNELCVSECESRGFSFAATQYYTECCKDITSRFPGPTNMTARLRGLPADGFRGSS